MAPIVSTETLPGLLEQLNRLTSATYTAGSFSSPGARRDFTRLTERLAILARDPAENVYHCGTRTAHNSAIRCSISLGIFDHVPISYDGSDPAQAAVHIDELALKTGADKVLVQRLMRVLVACNIFDEQAEGLYSHNHLSQCFLDKKHRSSRQFIPFSELNWERQQS
jgi:hypothetical protein